MPDKSLSWAIAEIEAAMATAVRQRQYYRRMLGGAKKATNAGYLAMMQCMRQKWDGKVLGLEAARQIVMQVDESA